MSAPALSPKVAAKQLGLTKSKKQTPVGAMLQSFMEAHRDEAHDEPAARWGPKCNFSALDSEAVLASGAAQSGEPVVVVMVGHELRHALAAGLATSSGTPSPPVPLMELPTADPDEISAMLGCPVEVLQPPRRSTRALERACGTSTVSRDVDTACPICLDKMVVGQVALVLPCMHQVHRECAQAYFGAAAREAEPACPLCRSKICSTFEKST